MSVAGLTVLAVVPARGGSKGIVGKNLRQVAGVSLVGRAAQVVAATSCIDRAVLSTDDDEIAVEGERYGLESPFRRPAELASDTANSIDMWRHAILAAEAHYDTRFDVSVLLEPTSPLREPADIERTLGSLVDHESAAAATVSRTPAHFTPHKTLTVDDAGRIGFYLPDGARHSIRQTVPAYFHRNGICYAVRRATVVDHRRIIEEDCVAVVIDRPVVNIDEELDLRIAEMLLRDRRDR